MEFFQITLFIILQFGLQKIKTMNYIQRISDNKYLFNNTWVINSSDASQLTNDQCQQAKQTFGVYKVRMIPVAKNSNGYTTSELLALENPIKSKLYFNKDINSLCFYDGENWKKTTSENL